MCRNGEINGVFVANIRFANGIHSIVKKSAVNLTVFMVKNALLNERVIRCVEHSRYKEPLQFKTARRCRLCQKDKQHCPWLPAQAAANRSRQAANPRNSSAPTAEKSRLNATGNAANSDDSTSVPNAVSRDLKRRLGMGNVLVTYKVFPEDIVKDFH